ncbi:alpha/beta hydrolase [Limosilactobacillus secaliphilus]|uniref:Cell surface hydrolase n=1 Tax=Limosilactobacillus secaliphilus TaxID=396268 RepID=A0A0R2I7M7_9LACO|nr:alpha/beta hydrolase [Limosilactobacillus secaliphilus]KRN58332.1 cell surface hydrolase [Limosilactobacillus secaliphilus]
MKHKHLWTGVALVAVGLALGGGIWHVHQEKAAAAKYVNNQTTTFFFHGWGSSSHAEEHMANAAKRAGATDTIIKANVDKHGKTTISGKITKKSKNPIVEVNFADNKNGDYEQDGRYAKSAIQTVSKKFGIKKMNLVGHSMGNLAIVFYLLQNADNHSLPTLEHHVAIAGHFDGGLGFGWNKKTKLAQDGKPFIMEKNYKKLLPLRDSYPQSARVLNIAGDLDDGSHSDSEIPVDSAFSLKYLINNRAKSYRQVVIHGRRAQHSKLHSNKQVDKLLIDFLWGKDNQ